MNNYTHQTTNFRDDQIEFLLGRAKVVETLENGSGTASALRELATNPRPSTTSLELARTFFLGVAQQLIQSGSQGQQFIERVNVMVSDLETSLLQQQRLKKDKPAPILTL